VELGIIIILPMTDAAFAATIGTAAAAAPYQHRQNVLHVKQGKN
jgi:hypothetical protein